jgi:2-oxoglutarate/2-oxoacid ferredoxin oxidoreductase subunit alpha
MAKVLLKGNEAIGEAAIHAGCRHFFGYPITPQSEIPEYLSKRFPEVGGVYVQAESEVAASNMLYGAASAGIRVFTSSSSPGISLMTEAISYMAGAELPCVIINIVRAGPGLGGILPSQSDYFQATKGGGHGDYRMLVLAPSTVQEAVDLTIDAFELADKYRNPVMIMGDGIIGQMMEPVEFKKTINPEDLPLKTWSTYGCKNRKPNIITSLFLDPLVLEQLNIKLSAKYHQMERDEVRHESYECSSKMDVLLVAYGTMARICKTVIHDIKKKGIKVGLFRPISLYPYPYAALKKEGLKAKQILTIEMSTGQMVEDVRLAMEGAKPISFYGRQGGIVPSPEEVITQIEHLVQKEGKK